MPSVFERAGVPPPWAPSHVDATSLAVGGDDASGASAEASPAEDGSGRGGLESPLLPPARDRPAARIN